MRAVRRLTFGCLGLEITPKPRQSFDGSRCVPASCYGRAATAGIITFTPCHGVFNISRGLLGDFHCFPFWQEEAFCAPSSCYQFPPRVNIWHRCAICVELNTDLNCTLFLSSAASIANLITPSGVQESFFIIDAFCVSTVDSSHIFIELAIRTA
ncbi:hypothetical protein D3C72_1484260 [compost metagenome]